MPESMPVTTETVFETAVDDPPALVHAGWRARFPWLIQGTTTRGRGSDPFDLGLFSGGSPESEARRSWMALVRAVGADTAVHARQPHGSAVRVWSSGGEGRHGGEGDGGPRDPEGREVDGVPRLVEDCDGHVTDEPGVLLAVTTADCVPVFAVDSGRRAVGMIHAGWRGAAAGILEEGLGTMREQFGTRVDDVLLHLGPAICGACYEVGPEVFRAFGLTPPEDPAPLDLRGFLARRAVSLGIPADRVTVSGHCTRCTGSDLFSHRGGDAGRQVGFIGVGRELRRRV